MAIFLSCHSAFVYRVYKNLFQFHTQIAHHKSIIVGCLINHFRDGLSAAVTGFALNANEFGLIAGVGCLKRGSILKGMRRHHTIIVDVKDYTEMEILGATRDDAAGECFDKAARVLGLPYPGGKPMDELARQSQGGVYDLPRAHVDGADLDMSFSGLKTAVVNLAHNAQQKGEPLDRAALARDFTRAVSDELVPRAMEAARRCGRKTIVAAGGVAANSIIRADLKAACEKEGCTLYVPPLSLCGDNGAMIGAQGYYEYLAGKRGGLDLNAYATMDLDERE